MFLCVCIYVHIYTNIFIQTKTHVPSAYTRAFRHTSLHEIHAYHHVQSHQQERFYTKAQRDMLQKKREKYLAADRSVIEQERQKEKHLNSKLYVAADNIDAPSLLEIKDTLTEGFKTGGERFKKGLMKNTEKIGEGIKKTVKLENVKKLASTKPLELASIQTVKKSVVFTKNQ
jgi:hypothetical protein